MFINTLGHFLINKQVKKNILSIIYKNNDFRTENRFADYFAFRRKKFTLKKIPK